MKNFIAEFKKFISRGNIMDMAIGVVIATAFGNITNSLVNDIIMPLVSWLTGKGGLNPMNLIIKVPEVVVDDTVIAEAATITIGFGTFLNTVIDFIIIALVVFAIMKSFNKARELLQKKEEEEKEEKKEDPPKPTTEELLAEILKELKEKETK